jgi:ankyrin repeat protein
LFAAGGGHEAVVRPLLEKGADADSKATTKSFEGDWTLLSFAAHEAIVKLLLEKGADADSKTTPGLFQEGRTPLSYAAERGYEAIVKLLLEKGADAESKATGLLDYGWTPLLLQPSPLRPQLRD